MSYLSIEKKVICAWVMKLTTKTVYYLALVLKGSMVRSRWNKHDNSYRHLRDVYKQVLNYVGKVKHLHPQTLKFTKADKYRSLLNTQKVVCIIYFCYKKVLYYISAHQHLEYFCVKKVIEQTVQYTKFNLYRSFISNH